MVERVEEEQQVGRSETTLFKHFGSSFFWLFFTWHDFWVEVEVVLKECWVALLIDYNEPPA
jgi:hypothetical protein